MVEAAPPVWSQAWKPKVAVSPFWPSGMYRTCAVECAEARPDLAGEPRSAFLHRMIDLHRGLLLKTFVEVAYVDHHWTDEELLLARELYEHVWRRQLDDKQLRVALSHFLDQSDLTWDVLLGPFERLKEFRQRAPELQTVVLRIANLVATTLLCVSCMRPARFTNRRRDSLLMLRRR